MRRRAARPGRTREGGPGRQGIRRTAGRGGAARRPHACGAASPAPPSPKAAPNPCTGISCGRRARWRPCFPWQAPRRDEFGESRETFIGTVELPANKSCCFCPRTALAAPQGRTLWPPSRLDHRAADTPGSLPARRVPFGLSMPSPAQARHAPCDTHRSLQGRGPIQCTCINSHAAIRAQSALVLISFTVSGSLYRVIHYAYVWRRICKHKNSWNLNVAKARGAIARNGRILSCIDDVQVMLPLPMHPKPAVTPL